MDDVVELNLSRPVNVTTTDFIRASIADRIEAEALDGPPIELVRFHVFIHCTGGEGRHMVDFEDHDLSPCTAIWIRPGQVQRWSPTNDDFHAEVAVFSSESVPDLPLFDRFLGTTSVAQVGGDSDRIHQQIEWMTADLAANGDHAVAAAALGVVLRLFARQADAGTDDTPARRVAEDFVASIDNNIDRRAVAWHASNIGASTRTVARATAATLDQRPKEVIDGRVILEAQRRLAWSTEDIATIARTLRFSEASNFTKFFRLRTGISPSAFRETVDNVTSPRWKNGTEPAIAPMTSR